MPQRLDILRQAIAAALLAVAVLLSAMPVMADSNEAGPIFGYSVNSSGNFTANDEVNALWRINLLTGAATRVFSTQRVPTGYLDLETLAFNDQGHLYGADDESKTLVRVFTGNGLAVSISSPSPSTGNMGVPLTPPLDFGMTFTCDGQLLVTSATEQSLFTADPSQGTLTRMGAVGALGVSLADLAASSDAIYAIEMGQTAAGRTPDPALYRIRRDPLAVERIGSLGPAVLPYRSAGLAFDEQGQLWAVTNRRNIDDQDFPSQTLRIDTETGSAEAVAQTQVVGDDAVVGGQALVGLESLAITGPSACTASQDPGPVNVVADQAIMEEAGPVAIPVLSQPMLLLLMVLLGILGAVTAARQHRQGDAS